MNFNWYRHFRTGPWMSGLFSLLNERFPSNLRKIADNPRNIRIINNY